MDNEATGNGINGINSGNGSGSNGASGAGDGGGANGTNAAGAGRAGNGVAPRRPTLPDMATVRAALEAEHGIQGRAAERLGIPRSTLQAWLTRGPLAELQSYARQLRSQYAPQAQGRPWTMDGQRSREVVAQAWQASGYRLAPAAAALGIPRSSLRHLLHRYELPNLPASGREPSRKRRP
jgi:DNA-binding NtrC family response regulator